MDEEKRPKVGVGVFIFKDGKILMQKRKGALGDGNWGFPGGHLEFNETLENCAARETMEEMGVKIKNIKIGPCVNYIHNSEGVHYVVIFVLSDYESGEAKTMEPDKSEEFGWFEWGKLPEPLFLPIRNLIEQGYSPKI